MNIFSLCLALFINAMSIGLVFPIFAPLFTQSYDPLFDPGVSLGVQTFFLSMILAIPTFCMIFGAPFWGRLSDRMGRKKVLLVSLLGIALSFGLSAFGIFQGSLWILFLSRALAGFMDGSESIAQAALVDLSAPKDKDRHMGYGTFAGTIGFIVGPIIGGFLAEPSLTGRFHYEIPFIVSLALTLANALALYYFLPKKIANAVHPKENKQMNYIKVLAQGFAICFDKRIQLFSVSLFVLQWCLAGFFQLSTLILAEKFQYSSGEIGVFTTFLGACFSGGLFFVIHVLLGRVAYLTLLRSGIILLILSISSAIYFHGTPLLAWVAVVPMMLGISMMYNVLLVLMSNKVAAHEQGEVMGGGTALKGLAWLTSGLVISYFYPNAISILMCMLLLVVIALCSTMGMSKRSGCVYG